MTAFGDRVRIREAPETLAANVAGLEGEVYGFTTPSTTGVDVIGGAPDDYALNVSLQSTDTASWFRPNLVEFLHHNPGAEAVVGDMRLVRQPDGSWLEAEPADASTVPSSDPNLSFVEQLVRAFKRMRRDA